MENLTLTSAQFSSLKKAFAVVCGIIAVAIAAAQVHSGAEYSLVQLFRWGSAALTITTGLFWVFYRWAWRWAWIHKWTDQPLVRGVWLGYLSSDYGRKPTDPPLRKPIVFVVRQTYLSLSIQSFTDRQVGESKVEALLRNGRTQAVRLAYVFELKNDYPGTRTLVNGAGDLELLTDSSVLHGNYWTSTPTHGSLRLRRVASDGDNVKRFEDAVKRWPIGPQWDVK
ncbi:MAG: hypothetical protein WDO68_25060 [Gammaproteobacteria bacterium]